MHFPTGASSSTPRLSANALLGGKWSLRFESPNWTVTFRDRVRRDRYIPSIWGREERNELGKPVSDLEQEGHPRSGQRIVRSGLGDARTGHRSKRRNF